MSNAAVRMAVAVLVGLLFTACVTARPAGTAYSGQVYIVDKQENTLTLYQNGNLVRVKVTPDQLRGLQLWQSTTVYGELAPPTQIARLTSAGRIAGPKGPADEITAAGTVGLIDRAGNLVVTIPGGSVRVWTARPGASIFGVGDRVRVHISVQPLEVVQVTPGETPRPEWTPSPVVPERTPGEYAVVVGRVTAVDLSGRLSLETPRGTVEVMVPNRERYHPGDMVEVRSAVQAAG